MSSVRIPAPREAEATYEWATPKSEVVVVRHHGKLHACSAICPHMGARLEPTEGGRRLQCPWHGLSVDVASGTTTHRRYPKVRRFEVTEEGADAIVRLR